MEMSDLDEIARLHGLIGEANVKMWDQRAEIDHLHVLLRDALPFVNDAGTDEDPEARRYAIETADAIRKALEGK